MIKMDPEGLVSQTMNKPHSRHNPAIQDLSALSRTSQDDDISQDHFSSLRQSQDMDQWTLSTTESLESSPIVTQPETPEVAMLSYSFSHQLIPSTTNLNDTAMFPSLSDLQSAGGIHDHAEMDFPSTHFGQAFASSLFEYNFENDDTARGCMQDDTASPGHASHHEDGQLLSTQDTWNLSLDTANIAGAHFDRLTHVLSPPVSPPLTETSQASTSSQTAYSFPGNDDAFMSDQKINISDPFNPMSPPLNDQDPNRTIRPTKQSQRMLLSASAPRTTRKSDPETYTLQMGESASQAKDKSEIRTPRDHPYYALSISSDGKYYCPFANGENPCSHPPTTQKCAYHKYLDSHLKPYRCKVATCAAQNLHFSSNACLFRHEREAHGFHGHGDNPHLCLFEGCERAVAGYGFPRRWNLFDHMKRVHDYTASEQPSSPEANATGQVLKKKDPSGVRKRRVTKTVTAPSMKRTKSTSSQGNAVKTNSVQHSQRLQNAERNYFNCRSRLLEKLANITPQDSVMHEKANASLQELITLGLNYRQLKASSAATHMVSEL